MKNDIIEVKIKCSSRECDKLREAGLFFEAIADALMIDRNDIEEVEPNKDKNGVPFKIDLQVFYKEVK